MVPQCSSCFTSPSYSSVAQRRRWAAEGRQGHGEYSSGVSVDMLKHSMSRDRGSDPLWHTCSHKPFPVTTSALSHRDRFCKVWSKEKALLLRESWERTQHRSPGQPLSNKESQTKKQSTFCPYFNRDGSVIIALSWHTKHHVYQTYFISLKRT